MDNMEQLIKQLEANVMNLKVLNEKNKETGEDISREVFWVNEVILTAIKGIEYCTGTDEVRRTYESL